MKKWLILLLLLVLISFVWGAGSITETLLRPTGMPKWEMHKITLDWTSDASGDVSGTATTVPIDGEIYRVVTIPDSGSDAPTDNWDFDLLDDDSVDVLDGLGDNEPNTGSNQFSPILDGRDDGSNFGLRPAVHGMLTLVVSNAGNAKGGKVIIYWK
jgi:hypothetical protein